MNYLCYKSKKWGKINRATHTCRVIKKKQSSLNERKDPLFYSFKNNDQHNKKLFSESLRSFQGNHVNSNPITQFQEECNSNQFTQKKDKNSFDKEHSNKANHNDSQNSSDEMNQIEGKEKKESDEDFIDYDNDIRLEITLQRLGLDDLIHVFNNFNITFNDLLFLEKEDLDEMQLHLVQKNRLLAFIDEYAQNSSQYTIEEILLFFKNNPKYKALAQNNRE